MDLIARGYAVEIVSPDAIPDNLADLELRVEADAGNELTATVETHVSGHAASLDFVHHLKAPMGNFVRRPLETSEPVYFPAPVSFNAEQDVAEDVELPSEHWRVPKPALPKLEVVPYPEESARLITPLQQVPPIVPEPPPLVVEEPVKHVRRGILHGVTVRIRHSQTRPGGWFWRAAMTFSIVVAVALVLGWGVRRGDASFDRESQSQPGKTTVTSASNLPANAESVAASAPASAAKLAENPAPMKKVRTPRISARSRKSRGPRSHKKGDDLVARDTVIYVDRPASSAPTKESPRRRATSRKQSGSAVTADTSPL